MIISQVIGGLGNQMFQYAAGRALSVELGQPLRLDIANFAEYGLHHGFELKRVFHCKVDTATKADVQKILGWQSLPGIRRVLSRPSMALFRHDAFVVEPHFPYWPDINKVPRNCYLVGYWQSEKYFAKQMSNIRSDFIFKPPLSNKNMDLAGQIAQVNAVSLHVRRGDYFSNPKTNIAHGVCNLDYYKAAVQHIAAKVEHPSFFIFSDDIEWAKKNLKMNFHHHFIDHNQGLESYNDMHLMSLCRHHIVANSSFSWWGAWLNSHTDKIVVAPKQWFANYKNTQDLVPLKWVRL